MRSFAHSSPRSSRGCPRRRRSSILLALLAATSFGIGCGGPRVSLSGSNAIVRAGPDVRGSVYVWDGSDWVLSANEVEIPEGWYIAPIED